MTVTYTVETVVPPLPTRAERVVEAQRLRNEESLTSQEIAERFGVTRSAVSSWLCDPDLSKQLARRERYAGTCVDCGAKTTGCNGPLKAPKRCAACFHSSYDNTVKRQIWPVAVLIARIQEWARIYGDPPAMNDWNPTSARSMHDEARARRWEDADGYWPWFTTVVNRFGTWNAGIEAAGFEPRVPYATVENMLRRRSMRERMAA